MNEYYRSHLEVGKEYQDFVSDKLYELGLIAINYTSTKYQKTKGENKNGIEIKLNSKYSEYGYCYFEVKEKSDSNNGSYIPSGIYGNSWLYVTGDYKTIFIFSTKFLKYHCEQVCSQIKEIPNRTSMGFTLGEADLNRLCLYRINIKDTTLQAMVTPDVIPSQQQLTLLTDYDDAPGRL